MWKTLCAQNSVLEIFGFQNLVTLKSSDGVFTKIEMLYEFA